LEKEPRKASEVLLELEAKIDVLMSIVRTQDLNIKILSNKVNSLLEKADKPTIISPPVIKVEAVDTRPLSDDNRQITVAPEHALPIEREPQGFRRTSRPETYSGDDAYLKRSSSTAVVAPKFPTQIPKLMEPEVVVPNQATKFTEIPSKKKADQPAPSGNNIPVMQRIVDKNGKSVFLADVEIIQSENMQTVVKTRTNGAGKWMQSLPIGTYRVFVRKRESLNKEKLEIVQDIQVDGSKSPLELQTMIIKA
jgi:hypothetical protein